MFDISTTKTINITNFDTHIIGTLSYDVKVYYKVGTYAGFETNAGAWSLLGNSTVTGAGLGNPTSINIGGLTIPAGATYGIYVMMDIGDNAVTIGMQTYSNSDIQITTGPTLCDFTNEFAGVVGNFEWNGTVYYTYADDVPAANNVPAFNPNDGRLNRAAGDEGQPVAIYQGSVKVYGIDPTTSQGTLEIHLTDEQIEAAGIPSESEWSRLLKRGENHATGMPIEVYRLATGEFQVNTYFQTGKPYIFRWHPDDPYNGVYVEW